MRKVRNYNKILNEFINISSPLEIKIMDSVHANEECYPMFYFYYHTKAKYNIVINAGCHGNESIGVKIMLRFLQEFDKEMLNNYNIWLFPIVNPFGYVYDVRYNNMKYDINRHCYSQKPFPIETAEFKIIDDELPNRVDVFIDIHQNGKKNFYCYEKKRPNKASLASFGMEEIKKQNIAIEECALLYGEKCINGVVDSIKDKSNTFEDYAFRKGALYSLTLENPNKTDEEELIIGSLGFLKEVLNRFKELK